MASTRSSSNGSSNALRTLMLAPLVLGSGKLVALRPDLRLILGVGLLAPLGYILVLSALAGGAPLSVVAPIRELSMTVGALLAVVVLKERMSRRRFAGCASMAAGVVLLAVSA